MADVAITRKDSARERLLDLAEAAILEKGFASTSIEELIVAAGITKSGFFYHFKSKGELARAILERYLERDAEILNDLFRRGDELNDDPLHGFLVGLKMFAEMMADLPGVHPGCLTASFCYQERLFDRDIQELNRTGVMRWRRRFRERLELIKERYPPRIDVDLDALADMATAIVDGGITISKNLKDPALLPRQVLLYRQFIRAIFLPG
jgi:TetR/AcrR family transcriptional regulator, transcriptional repressor for nem operon